MQAPSPARSPLVAGSASLICSVPGVPVATSVAALYGGEPGAKLVPLPEGLVPANVQAETAAAKCNALITKGKKLVVVYERVYKYKFVKNKRSKSFTRKIVKVKQKLKVPCAKQCVTSLVDPVLDP